MPFDGFFDSCLLYSGWDGRKGLTPTSDLRLFPFDVSLLPFAFPAATTAFCLRSVFPSAFVHRLSSIAHRPLSIVHRPSSIVHFICAIIYDVNYSRCRFFQLAKSSFFGRFSFLNRSAWQTPPLQGRECCDINLAWPPSGEALTGPTYSTRHHSVSFFCFEIRGFAIS